MIDRSLWPDIWIGKRGRAVNKTQRDIFKALFKCFLLQIQFDFISFFDNPQKHPPAIPFEWVFTKHVGWIWLFLKKLLLTIFRQLFFNFPFTSTPNFYPIDVCLKKSKFMYTSQTAAAELQQIWILIQTWLTAGWRSANSPSILPTGFCFDFHASLIMRLKIGSRWCSALCQVGAAQLAVLAAVKSTKRVPAWGPGVHSSPGLQSKQGPGVA